MKQKADSYWVRNFLVIMQWGRGCYKKIFPFSLPISFSHFIIFVLGLLFLFNCGPAEQIIHTYKFNENNGLVITEKIIIYEMEFSPKQFYKKQFAIRYQEKYVPGHIETIELYPDKSIRKVRLIWIASDIQPHETRNYQIVAYSGHISRGKYIQQVKNQYLFESARNLKFLISSNGLSEMHDSAQIRLIQDGFQVIDEKGALHQTSKTSAKSIKLLQQSDFCSQIEVTGLIDSIGDYSQFYTIFHQLPLVLYTKNLKFHHDRHHQLVEAFSFNIENLQDVIATFYGWTKKSTKIEPHTDIYDYQIAQNPDSYLFLKYLNDEVTDLKYHFVERRKSDQRRLNLYSTMQLDSALSLTLSIPNGQWKRHAAFHFGKDSVALHLSWHAHGFQKRAHWSRFYRSNWHETWAADSSRTFKAMIFFHSPESSSENLKESLKNYLDLSTYFN